MAKKKKKRKIIDIEIKVDYYLFLYNRQNIKMIWLTGRADELFFFDNDSMIHNNRMIDFGIGGEEE